MTDGSVLKGYIDCHFYQFQYLYDVYQCFEDEAKKLCANIVFEFSLNPIPMFNANSNNAQNPGILGTGMAVCNPNFPGLDEKVYLLIPITIVFNKTDIQDTSDVYCLSLS